MSSVNSSVALLGLGSMGVSLARALLKADTSLRIWNRTHDRLGIEDLVASGAKLCTTASDAAKGCSIIIVCVLDYETVYAILSGLDQDALEGKVIVNLTNCTPKDARQMSGFVKGEKIGAKAYFDGAIMTTPALIGTQASFLFCSGEDEATFRGEGVGDVLETFGTVDYLGPDDGAAALYDLALLAGMYGMFGGTLTAIGLLSKRLHTPDGNTGLKISVVVQNKLVPMLQALLPALVGIAAQTEDNDPNAYDHPNSMQYHGMKNILQACEEEGVDGGPLQHLYSVFEAVEKEGGGQGGMGLIGRRFLL